MHILAEVNFQKGKQAAWNRLEFRLVCREEQLQRVISRGVGQTDHWRELSLHHTTGTETSLCSQISLAAAGDPLSWEAIMHTKRAWKRRIGFEGASHAIFTYK